MSPYTRFFLYCIESQEGFFGNFGFDNNNNNNNNNNNPNPNSNNNNINSKDGFFDVGGTKFFLRGRYKPKSIVGSMLLVSSPFFAF